MRVRRQRHHGTYLRDETGGRRFWPWSGKRRPSTWTGWRSAGTNCGPSHSALFRREAVVAGLGSPESGAASEQSDRYEGDPWDELILKWIEDRESVSIMDVLSVCLEKKKDTWTQWDKIRVARCLREQGWSVQRRVSRCEGVAISALRMKRCSVSACSSLCSSLRFQSNSLILQACSRCSSLSL